MIGSRETWFGSDGVGRYLRLGQELMKDVLAVWTVPNYPGVRQEFWDKRLNWRLNEGTG